MADLVSQCISFLKGIWKYRWPAVAIAWLVAIVGWIAIYSLRDNYQSSARVFVDTQSILKPLLAGMTSVPNVEQQVSIMSRTLLSRPNVERVIRMVDLDLKENSGKDHERLVDSLMAQIKIAGTSQNDIYTITYTGDKPKLAKDVVQSLLTIFVEGSFGNKKQDSAKAIQFIDDQIKAYEEKLVAAENALKEFKLKNMGLLPRQGSDYGNKLFETSDDLTQARLELREAEQARDAIRKQIYGDEMAGKGGRQAESSLPNPEIDERIQSLNKNLDTLRLQFTEQHPDIVSTKRLIAQLEARKIEEAKHRKPGIDPGANYSPMLQQLKVSLSAAEARAASMRARVDEYSSRIARLKEMSIAAPEVESQLAQLNRDYLINKENYEKLVASRESAKLSGELSATTEMLTFRVIDPPTLPLTPTGPNRLRLLSLVFFAALAVGIGCAFLMSRIRPTFLSASSLREVTDLPILGSISMKWTDHEKARRTRSLYAFGFSAACLLIAYGGVIAGAVIKA
ncbi:chain length-determining protein [Noviherbaspirillum cavernae]|uniref:Chain length-determining protein n=1 Tax=Noviherbaspirillum cavernae TaxID=2320862 RepID=A0A418X3L5_9BURK|nr:XrtA system polysaccharide chain length determinant [Noviherbaspirillum cavernae]RJG07053.1 chain length-determining protein [Noviherbaspirillum cavernae]